jgi:AraC-like DNA-binding protein
MESFSTAGLRSHDVLPFWRDYVCKTYVPVEMSEIDEGKLLATGWTASFGQTMVTRIVSTPLSYERTRRNIKAADGGEYLLSLLTQGEMRFEQRDRSDRIGPGDLCLLDTAQPYRLHFSHAYEGIHVKIPRREFDRRLPLAEKISALRVASEGRYARLAATMLRTTVELVDDTSPRQLAPALIDLIALAFDETFSDLSTDNSRYARIVSRAQEAISDHLLDPEFDLSTIPASIGVSSRTLSRAFAQQGLTPSKWMWTKRLDAAHDMIRLARGRSVSEVAMTCGFNDFSHFSRAFKAKFGISPSGVMQKN